MTLTPSLQSPLVWEFLQRNGIAVLATASKTNGEPYAAVIYYSVTSKFNFYFVTKTDTQKSKNIEANPQVALVVFEASTQMTAQISGRAERVDDPDRLKTALNIMAKHAQSTAQSNELPVSRLNAGDYILYKISPQNIRLADYKYGVSNHLFEVATGAEESLE